MMQSTMMITMITMMMLMLTIKMSKKNKFSQEKNSPFECGFSFFYSSRKPFSIQFFMVAMMFLIFDIEISMILPMMTTKMNNMKEWLVISLISMIMLTFGLIHEWKNGMIEWSK
uniref:NADH dehydrogenase subunit 3 n=1 Tax=Diostrombus politus TaxID=130564 RepID=UPI002A805CE4|nr:NADH dehydrogenase subunit 3 [Diostrombus politus]WOW99041.1 NADH dehydrogenase subunit 3 [Diostrombus politus]